FAERPLELDEDVGESEIDRFGHELCLAARKVAPERATRATGVSDDLAESNAVDAALPDEHCGAFHHARATAPTGLAARVWRRDLSDSRLAREGGRRPGFAKKSSPADPKVRRTRLLTPTMRNMSRG